MHNTGAVKSQNAATVPAIEHSQISKNYDIPSQFLPFWLSSEDEDEDDDEEDVDDDAEVAVLAASAVVGRQPGGRSSLHRATVIRDADTDTL